MSKTEARLFASPLSSLLKHNMPGMIKKKGNYSEDYFTFPILHNLS